MMTRAHLLDAQHAHLPRHPLFRRHRRLGQRAENAVPLDETTLPSDGPAQYVLEINAGLVERFGMGEGTVIRHPAIEQDGAAWPCEAE
jgi:hypothetical protein